MMQYNIVMTSEAIYDVADMADYIALRFGRERAEDFTCDIYNQINDLSYMGGTGSSTYIFYCDYLIYKKPFPPSIIFYILDESKQEVHVLRVLREESNWRAVIKQHRKYTYP